MLDQFKQLMEIKKQAERIKKELDGIVLDVEDVRGIKLNVTASQHFKSIEIEEGLLRPENKHKLESDILRSMNAAMKKAQATAAQKMASVMPGLS